jgi:hypothetical protein
MGGSGVKALLTVPMIGAGTWDDPRRPALVREAGVGFRYQVSDDGTMALVEAAPGDLAGMAKLEELAKKEPRAKVFRPERDKHADVVAAFKLLKKDFDPASFTQLGVGATPVATPGK